jgi:signal transduction histidine kinase
LPNALNAPLLLIPSRYFVDVEEPAPENPFAAPKHPIADFTAETAESSWIHRARAEGEVIYREAQSFFIQDNSGGIRVLAADRSVAKVGDTVEVLGFPSITGAARTLTEALVRPVKSVVNVKPKALDLSEAPSSRQNDTLVLVNATLLARKTNGLSQVLELQEQQRVFAATFPASQGSLPNIIPGSRLQVIGVCNNETAVSSPAGDKPVMAQYMPSLNILLRSPGDVTVLNGPPWWTWKRVVLLVGTLLAVLAVTLLWVHQLRRRLERQQAAQLAFSRQVLERLEDERRRIAANLHDSLGQILLVIKNHALLAIQRPPDEQGLRQRLDEISGASSQAIEEVRQITHGLRPYQLDRLGLTQAIRASISRASANSPISFATRVKDIDGLFDKEAEIHVDRIVQEAVTNVVKHSAATEAAVVIMKRSAAVLLSIRDNGHGFDTAKPSPQPRDLGYGLTGITERVRILGGTLTIDSRPGGGTSVTVEAPLPVRKT